MAWDTSNTTINANGNCNIEEVNAFGDANVTVNVTGKNDFEEINAYNNANVTVRGTECQKKDVVNIGEGEDDTGITAERGNVTIDHVTVNLQGKEAEIGSKGGNLNVLTSKIAGDNDNKYTLIQSGKAMKISEPVIDIVGTIRANSKMVIAHSDVKVTKPEANYDDAPQRVFSLAGIELIDEKNGEVKQGTANGKTIWYVDTGEGNKEVDLEADVEPAYYHCDSDVDDERTKLAKTSDATSVLPMFGAALAGAATLGLARLRAAMDKKRR